MEWVLFLAWVSFYALIIHIYQASNSHHEDDSNFLVGNPELNLYLLMTFLGGV